MLHDEAIKKIQEILGNDISFEGHFNIVFDSLKENMQQQLIDWVRDCKEGKTITITIVGNEKRFDIKALEKYGKVEMVKEKDLFVN